MVKINYLNNTLFNCNHALCHCISEDLRMSSGIKLNNFDKLKRQNLIIGDAAFLVELNIFYLITKRFYWNKTDSDSLENSLLNLKKLIIDNKVTDIALPKISCGLEQFNWDVIHNFISNIFKDTTLNIHVYYLL